MPMKKIALLFFSLVMVLGISGCGNGSPETYQKAPVAIGHTYVLANDSLLLDVGNNGRTYYHTELVLPTSNKGVTQEFAAVLESAGADHNPEHLIDGDTANFRVLKVFVDNDLKRDQMKIISQQTYNRYFAHYTTYNVYIYAFSQDAANGFLTI